MIDTVSIRNSILRLAFSGNLTERTDTDDRVEDLLSRVNPKKSIAQDEGLPYEIPSEWAKVKLVDLYKINPRVEADENEEAAFIPMEKISPGYDDDFTYETQSWGQASKNHTKFQNGDVAFAKISPCFENRKSFVARELPNGLGGGTTELIILRQKEMLPEYTYYLVLDQRFINTGAASYKGTVGQQRIQSDVVKNYVVPVPSVEEQKRIVKKISEAFSILDRIDALQDEYASNQEVLKSKLIDAAIQGKLTEHLPEDGTAEELYKLIGEKKKNLIKDGKLKKAKALPAIKLEDLPFEIPSNWGWYRLGDLGITVTGSTPPKSHSEYYGGNYPFFKPADLDRGKHITSASEYLTDAGKDVSRQLEKGTVLVCCIGSIGKCAIIDEEGTANQQINALTPINCSSEYLLYVISSQYFKKQLNEGARATTVSIINKAKFDNCIIPLPPQVEQERIVCRLNEILNNISE